MSIDRSRSWAPEGLGEEVDLELTTCALIEFSVDGRRYLLISYRDWLIQQAAAPVLGARRHTVAGRIMFNGEQHVVIEPAREPGVGPEPGKLDLADVLTRRELQVATLVSEGKCDKEIARALGISGYTVREHLRRTFAKLKVSRRSAMVAYVLQHWRPPPRVLAVDP